MSHARAISRSGATKGKKVNAVLRHKGPRGRIEVPNFPWRNHPSLHCSAILRFHKTRHKKLVKRDPGTTSKYGRI